MRPEDVCARLFVETHPEDAARLIEQASLSAAAPFLEGLPPHAAAGVIGHEHASALHGSRDTASRTGDCRGPPPTDGT
jgi:hypothetical protein